MHEIMSQRLWIASCLEARDLRHLLGAGIEAVVDLAMEESPLSATRELIYCRWPLIDGGGNDHRRITAATDTVRRLLESRIPTLVCCGAGMSRSPAIVAAALSLIENRPADAVLEELAARIPHDVSPVLWRDVTSALDKLRG